MLCIRRRAVPFEALHPRTHDILEIKSINHTTPGEIARTRTAPRWKYLPRPSRGGPLEPCKQAQQRPTDIEQKEEPVRIASKARAELGRAAGCLVKDPTRLELLPGTAVVCALLDNR